MTVRTEILVAEDDPLLREYVTVLLRKSGYSVMSATSGGEALEILGAGARPDLLFTDVLMAGGMDGFELARRARLISPELKVLYTSGYTGSTEREQLPAGSGFLPKPYRRRDCIEKVNSMLADP